MYTVNPLNRSERAVLDLIAKGLTNGNIACSLGLTSRQVETYITEIFQRLGVSSRVELLFWACSEQQGRAMNSNRSRRESQKKTAVLDSATGSPHLSTRRRVA
jgi:DNA-binding CsgD family transcriptional regulator